MTRLLFRDDAYARGCEATVTAVDERGIQLDDTLLYFSSGGQPGDRGTLTAADGRSVAIADTIRGPAFGDVLHVAVAGAPPLSVGDRVSVELDWERRYRHMRLHTCMHLLCAVVAAPVSGGQIHDDRARLDFDLQGASLDKAYIEERLNALIMAGHSVHTQWITDEELAASPDLVRTMSVKPPIGAGRVRLLDIPGVDLQACGGTHVANTAEIGRIAIFDVLSKGKQNRRVIVGFAQHDRERNGDRRVDTVLMQRALGRGDASLP